ncbi:MAG: hypothetical protein ACM3XZ_08205 [Betaproteobacteria bacterium]
MTFPRPDGRSLPAFLGRGTAAILTLAAPSAAKQPVQGDPAATAEAGLDAQASRLWQELFRRLESGETRLYEEDLKSTLAALPADLARSFQALRQAGLVDWEGPYLYLQCPSSNRAAQAEASPPAAAEEVALKKVWAAIEWATGKAVNPLEENRIREWVSILGCKDVLDEIGLCRERGPCQYRQISLALDRACRRRRQMSQFGPLNGHGVLSIGGAKPPTESEATTAVANARAYDPVQPELVERWVAAHPELYDDCPPGPPPSSTGGRPASWASAYDPLPPEALRRWAEAFPAEYEAYRREYVRLAEKAKSGPFRRRQPRIR